MRTIAKNNYCHSAQYSDKFHHSAQYCLLQSDRFQYANFFTNETCFWKSINSWSSPIRHLGWKGCWLVFEGDLHIRKYITWLLISKRILHNRKPKKQLQSNCLISKASGRHIDVIWYRQKSGRKRCRCHALGRI